MSWTTNYLYISKTIRFLVGGVILFLGVLVFSVFIYGQWTDVNADIRLDGRGLSLDSTAFWSDGTAESTYLFVTAPDNNLLEVWRFPFTASESRSVVFSLGTIINGVVVDPKRRHLYLTQGDETNGIYQVQVLSLPELKPLYQFGRGIIGKGETNLALLHVSESQTRVYVTDDHTVYFFAVHDNAATFLGHFMPAVSEIETLMADDYSQLIFVPEESGGAGKAPGIHVFDADGKAYFKNGANVFGQDQHFQGDAEGIALYRCMDSNHVDLGRGWIVVSDQRKSQSEFEFFDRNTWEHVGQLRISGVNDTDGIAVLETALPGYPQGIFSAIDDDSTVAIKGWHKIFDALSLSCQVDLHGSAQTGRYLLSTKLLAARRFE